MMRMKNKTVLVIDNDAETQEILTISLQHSGFSPLSANDLYAANRIIFKVPIDLILLDWMLPGQSGLSFTRELRSNCRTRHQSIIMLTERSAEADVIAGLEAGADDYVAKPFSPTELVARIKAVLRRRTAPEMNNEVAAMGPLKLDPASRRACVVFNDVAERLDLGPTEFSLLHYLMTHPERVHTRAQILDQLRSHHVFVEERTVDVYIKRLRACLAQVNLSHTVQTVRGAGYRLTAIS